MAFCHAWCNEVDGIRTYFVYSDEGLVGEYDSTGQEIRTYGWIPGSGWSTNPLFVKIEGVYYWYRNDHLGTPQKIVTTSGAIVWEAVYDSFGNCQIQVETITNNLRFPGQYYDSETGLCYNLNRYYDPTTGRYLRADPFGSGLNLYVYCFNNPLGLIDPMGLCALRTFFILQGQADFWAGFGDTLTSGLGLTHLLGIPSLTEWIRSLWNDQFWGGNDCINYESPLYSTGKFTGDIVGSILAEAAIAKISTRLLSLSRSGSNWLRRVYANSRFANEAGFIDRGLPSLNRVRNLSKFFSKSFTRAKEWVGTYPNKICGGGQLQPFSRLSWKYVDYAKTLVGNLNP